MRTTTAQRSVSPAVALLALLGCKHGPGEQRGQATPAGRDSAAVAAAPTAARTGYADANGARHYYEARGDLNSGKTPLLVLHGSLMSADAMVRSSSVSPASVR